MSEIRIKTLVVGMVGTNCYLVYDHETKRAAVIDPGDGAGQIANMAVSLGLKPEAILLTHGHFDHIMAAKELKETWNVPVKRVSWQAISENRIRSHRMSP